jgi:hypothetical protein
VVCFIVVVLLAAVGALFLPYRTSLWPGFLGRSVGGR